MAECQLELWWGARARQAYLLRTLLSDNFIHDPSLRVVLPDNQKLELASSVVVGVVSVSLEALDRVDVTDLLLELPAEFVSMLLLDTRFKAWTYLP